MRPSLYTNQLSFKDVFQFVEWVELIIERFCFIVASIECTDWLLKRKQMVQTLSHSLCCEETFAVEQVACTMYVYPMKSTHHYVSLGSSAHMFLAISMQPLCTYMEGSCLVANLFSWKINSPRDERAISSPYAPERIKNDGAARVTKRLAC